MSDLISREAAIDQLHQSYNLLDAERRLEDMPSAQQETMYYPQVDGVTPSVIAQPEQRTLTEDDYAYCTECDHVEMCRWYPMYGCEFKSRPSAQPDLQDCGKCIFKGFKQFQPEPQWIPCSEPPKESGTYIVTAYDGTDKRVTFVKYQKTLKRWDLTGARAYWRILAYKPLPEPWKGEEHDL